MTALPQHNRAVGQKDNKAFMILSALGILFVVDVHLGNCISFFTQVFPYDSFFMPMFAFISGYFFRRRHAQSWGSVFRYGVDKFRKLMIPYLGWIVFYAIVINGLSAVDLLEMGGFDLKDLIHNIITSGTSFGFNSASWFVPLLFCVAVAYCCIRKCFGRFWNDWAAMVVLALAGAAAVWASRTGFNTNNTYMILKVPFFLQFYHLGVLFRNHLEEAFDRLSGITVCVSAVSVNLLLMSRYGDAIAFPICSSMSGFYTDNPFLPLITSVTGTAFWLKIAKALVPVLGQNPLVNFISDNTFFIMTHHVGVKHLYLGILVLIQNLGLFWFPGLDVQLVRTDPWYMYSEQRWCMVGCYVFTMAVLILGCKGFGWIKEYLFSKLRK